jgi:hypothetical protein
MPPLDHRSEKSSAGMVTNMTMVTVKSCQRIGQPVCEVRLPTRPKVVGRVYVGLSSKSVACTPQPEANLYISWQVLTGRAGAPEPVLRVLGGSLRKFSMIRSCKKAAPGNAQCA